MKRIIAVVSVAAVVLLAVGAWGSPALGATYTLNLSGPTTAVVGQPVVWKVTGTAAPPAEYWDITWIGVYWIPASVVSECPADGYSAAQLAGRTGGAILAIAMRPNTDAAGNFENQVGATPAGPGTALICAYTTNEVGATKSRAVLTLTVRARNDTSTSSACRTAQRAVKKAERKLRQARSPRAKKRAKKRLKDAKRRRDAACA